MVWSMLRSVRSRERLALLPMLQIFTHPVEDDDGVVDGEADDRQHGGDEQAVHLPAEQLARAVANDPHRHQNIVQQRDHGAGAVLQPFFEAADGEAERPDRAR